MSLQVFLSLAGKGAELKTALERAFYAENKTELPINTSPTQTGVAAIFKLGVSIEQVAKKSGWEFDRLISNPPPELMQIIRILKDNIEELKPALDFYRAQRNIPSNFNTIQNLTKELETMGLDAPNAALCSECIDLAGKAGCLSNDAFDKLDPEDKKAFAEVQEVLGNSLWNYRLKCPT